MFKSLEITEMKNKITMKYHYMPIKWLKLKGLTTPNIIEDVGQLKLFIHYSWECWWVQPFWRTMCQFLKQLNICFPYDPTIPFLIIYPSEMKIYVRSTYVNRSVIHNYLIQIIKSWKQSKIYQQVIG